MAELDFSPIGDLYNVYKQSQQRAQRDQALQQFVQGSDRFDPNIRALIAADPQVGISLANLAQKDDQRKTALKLSESFGGMFGSPQAQPAPAQPTPGPASTDPRGIRNNNPLNIEAGPFTQGQPGYQGSDGRFARFERPEQGVGAANALLDVYQNQHGLNTVRGIIGRWAPSGENDTRGYVASVAGRLGVHPDQPLTPEQRQPLIAAMGQFENGRPIQTAGAGPQVIGPEGSPERPDARGVYSADAVMLPQQTDQAALPPNATPTQGYAVPGKPPADTPWPAAPQAGNPQAPQATLGGKSMDQWLPMMMRLATHPDAPPEVQKVAIEFVKAAQSEAGLTKEQKEYRGYVQQGGKDDFTTWDRKNRTASATLINTAEGNEAASQKARIAIDTHAVADLSKKVAAGRAALPLLDRAIALAAKTPEGWAGAASPTIARALSGLGFEVPDGISNAELLNSMTRQLIPAIRDPGSTSNYEQSIYTAALPSLNQSADGRIKIARMMKAQLQRNAEVMAIYRANIGSVDLDKKLAELDAKPLFAAEDRKELERIAGAGSGNDAGGGGQAGGNPYEDEMRRRGLLK